MPSLNQVFDRAACLERTKVRAEIPTIAGLPMIRLGGPCGKLCFQRPYRLTWSEANLDALEAVAPAHPCFIGYGAYPHLPYKTRLDVLARIAERPVQWSRHEHHDDHLP